MENSTVPITQLPESEARTWAMLAHLGSIFLGFVAPLLVWLIQKDKSSFVEYHGREALNFQIVVMIAYAAVTALAIITCGFGGVLYLVVWLGSLVFSIIAGLEANKGTMYQYPFNWRIIK